MDSNKSKQKPKEEQEEKIAESVEEAPSSETEKVATEPEDCDENRFTNERIQRILDIELPVSISFGSTKRPLGEVLKLGPGALLELDRVVEEPVILKVNNKVFAKGEIVDVDGYYGVHITEITSPAQRIESLGD